MSYYSDAAYFISKREGFTPIATWDKNAYRLGYGSDTITFNNGTYRKVKQGDSTNEDNARKDLARRIPEFEKNVINYINSKSGVTKEQWDSLPAPAKVGLLSFAYNYGNIVKPSIRQAIKTGDVDQIADAVIKSTINDNKGEDVYDGLRARRKLEADLIRSEKKQPSSSYKNVVKYGLLIGLILVSTYVLIKRYKKDAIPF